MHNYAHAHRGFRRVVALGFSNQAALRDTVAHQIVAANASLAEGGVGSGPTGCDHHGRHSAVEDVERVIETRAQYGRRTPGILRSSKDDNGVGGMDFLERGSVHYLTGYDDQEQQNACDQQKQQTKPPSRVRMLVGGFIGHSLGGHPYAVILSASIFRLSSLSEEL
jgi:hypothetical protein